MTDIIETSKFKEKILCKKCQQETWQKILNEITVEESDDVRDLWETTTYFTLQCMGCDYVCLVTNSYFSEELDQETGQPVMSVGIYPTPFKSDRELINGFTHIPKDIQSVYTESIKAFNNGMMILAAIGIRSVIEAIAIERKIAVRGIETKINRMVKMNIITPDGATLLMFIKDLGNLATHEIKKHHRDDLALCLDIIEGVLRSLYIHPKQAAFVKEMINGKWVRIE